MILGAHLPINGTIENTVRQAETLGMDTLSIFVGSPKSLHRLHPKRVDRIESNMKLVVHAPYVINAASNGKKDLATEILVNDVMVAINMGFSHFVFHPGNATDCSRKDAIENVREVLRALPNNINIAVETMAGKGTEIGITLEEMFAIMYGMPENIGICLDTCHMHDAGYDVDDTKEFIDIIKNVVGVNRIKVLHLNGSLNKMGSHSDRHACLRASNNCILVNSLRGLAQSDLIKDIPCIIETYENEKELLADMAFLRRKPMFTRAN